MARGVNKVILIGNSGADPELRYTPGGTAVSIEPSRHRNQRKLDRWQGRKAKNAPNGIALWVWGRLAEICNQYLRKGSKVYIEGKLQTRSWEGQDGLKRYTTEVVARDMQMLDTRGEMGGMDGGYDGGAPQGGGQSRPQSNDSASNDTSASDPPPYAADDDLPF